MVIVLVAGHVVVAEASASRPDGRDERDRLNELASREPLRLGWLAPECSPESPR